MAVEGTYLALMPRGDLAHTFATMRHRALKWPNHRRPNDPLSDKCEREYTGCLNMFLRY